MAILEAVQGALVNSPSPSSDAAALDVLTEEGSLYSDEYSRDYAAYAAIENRIESATNELAGQNPGVPIASLRTRATEDVLGTYDAGSPQAKAMSARFRDVNAKITEDPTGRSYGYTKTVTSGKTPLGERKALPTEAVDTTALDTREAELKGKLADPLDTDLIGRARRIQREKFGPSITQALRELPGNIRERRQARQLNRELQVIERFLDAGGTVEELQRITQRPEAAPEQRLGLTPEQRERQQRLRDVMDLEEAGVRGPGLSPAITRPETFRGPDDDLDVEQGRPETDFQRRLRESTQAVEDVRLPRLPLMGRPRVEAGMPQIRPPSAVEGVQGMRSTVSPEREAEMGILGTRPAPVTPMDLDEELGDTTLEAMPELEEMELTSPGREAKPQPGTRKLPKDKPKQRKAKP